MSMIHISRCKHCGKRVWIWDERYYHDPTNHMWCIDSANFKEWKRHLEEAR